MLAEQQPVTIEFATVSYGRKFKWICGGAATTALGAVDVASVYLHSMLHRKIGNPAPSVADYADTLYVEGDHFDDTSEKYFARSPAGTWIALTDIEITDMKDFMKLKGPDGKTNLSDYLFPDGSKSLPLQQFTAVQFRARPHGTVFTLGHTPKGDLQAIMVNQFKQHVPVWRILCDGNVDDISAVTPAIAVELRSAGSSQKSRSGFTTVYTLNTSNTRTTFTWPGSATTL